MKEAFLKYNTASFLIYVVGDVCSVNLFADWYGRSLVAPSLIFQLQYNSIRPDLDYANVPMKHFTVLSLVGLTDGDEIDTWSWWVKCPMFGYLKTSILIRQDDIYDDFLSEATFGAIYLDFFDCISPFFNWGAQASFKTNLESRTRVNMQCLIAMFYFVEGHRIWSFLTSVTVFHRCSRLPFSSFDICQSWVPSSDNRKKYRYFSTLSLRKSARSDIQSYCSVAVRRVLTCFF